MSYGRVVSVHKDRLGSQVTTAVTGDGTTRVIAVDSSVVDFDEDGGQLVHQPTGDVYSYSSADADAETITLAAGLPVGKTFSILDTLLVYPRSNDAYAQVMIDDDPTDIVSARIPGAIRDQIEEGGREIGKGDALGVLAGSEEWEVTGRLGAEGQGAIRPGFLQPTAASVAGGGVLLYDGWLLCDGSSVSRAQFSALFNEIGTTYGSASGTTFNLPDFRDRAVFGVGTQVSLGETDGAAVGDRGPGHTHNISADGVHNHGGSTGGNNAAAVDRASGGLGTAAQGHTHSMPDGGSHNHGGATGTGTGSANPFGFIGANILIKT